MGAKRLFIYGEKISLVCDCTHEEKMKVAFYSTDALPALYERRFDFP